LSDHTDVGPRCPDGFPLHGDMVMMANHGDVDQVLDNIQRNMDRLVHTVPMVQVEDLSEHMQRHVVGVPRAWVHLFQHLANVICLL
jgi:hypothetical protein